MSRHPLENPSLAPFGLTSRLSRGRLNYLPKDAPYYVNHERVIARLWDRYNRANAPQPQPIATIVHEILPTRGKQYRLTKGDFFFQGRPYLTRDIVVMSSIVQWLATNVGESFLRDPPLHRKFEWEQEFLIKTQEFDERWFRPKMVTFWTHVCSRDCHQPPTLFCDPHLYDPRIVTARDSAVAETFLRWLGSDNGRAFIADYHFVSKHIQDFTHKRLWRKSGLYRAA